MVKTFIPRLTAFFAFSFSTISFANPLIPTEFESYIEPNSFTCVNDGRLFGEGLTLVSRFGGQGSYTFRLLRFGMPSQATTLSMIDIEFTGINASGESECVQNSGSSPDLVSCFRERNFGEPYSSRVIQKKVHESFLTVSGQRMDRDLIEFEIVSPLTEKIFSKTLRFPQNLCQ